MAKIKRGEGLQDLRGSVGQHVYSDWRGRGYLRSKSISGSNPGSSRQADARSSMARFSQVWKTQLTDAQRDLWNGYAKKQDRKPKLRGAVLIIPYKGFTSSGYNTFVQINRLLYSAGLLAPGSFASVPPTGTELFAPPTNLVGIWNLGWFTALFEDFEDEANNVPPNNWTPSWSYIPVGTSFIKAQNLIAHLGVLSSQLAGVSLHVTSCLIQRLALTTDGAEVILWARASQLDKICPIIATTPAAAHANWGVFVAFWSDGKFFNSKAGGWETTGVPYNVNTWYQIKVKIHDALRTYDLYITDMVTPVKSGAVYRTNNSTIYLDLVTSNQGLATVYVDDLFLLEPVPLGVYLTWADPTMHANSRIRVWTYSEESGVHKQQVATVGLGVGEYTITHVRAAKGSSIPIASLPGHYWFQLDAVDPAGARSGPSNAILVNVPSS